MFQKQKSLHVMLIVVFCLFSAASAQGQNSADVLQQIENDWNTNPNIKYRSIPGQFLFSSEWDKLLKNSINIQDNSETMWRWPWLCDYSSDLNSVDQFYTSSQEAGSAVESWFQYRTHSQMARNFLDNRDVQNHFNDLYSFAEKSNSPIGLLSRDDVVRLWTESKVLFSNKPGNSISFDPQTQFCLWILCPCK